MPYENLPQTDLDQVLEELDSDLLDLPEDEWSAFFGCRECGRVDTYKRIQVFAGIQGKEQQARFHDDATLFLVEFECARRDCRSPAKLHIDTRGGSEKDLLELLKKGYFFGGLPCGHTMQRRFFALPKVRRVMQRLW